MIILPVARQTHPLSRVAKCDRSLLVDPSRSLRSAQEQLSLSSRQRLASTIGGAAPLPSQRLKPLKTSPLRAALALAASWARSEFDPPSPRCLLASLRHRPCRSAAAYSHPLQHDSATVALNRCSWLEIACNPSRSSSGQRGSPCPPRVPPAPVRSIRTRRYAT